MFRKAFRVCMCAAWVGLCTVLIVTPAWAQQPAGLDLRVKPGQTVWVMTTDGAEIKGVVTQMDPDSIEIRSDGGPRRIGHASITRVSKTDSLKNGFWIGAGIGALAGIGYAFDETTVEPGTERSAAGVAYFMVFGAGVYGGIGALIDRRKQGREVVFTRTDSAVRLAAAPIMSRRTIGLSATVRW